jgi:hypothetical protein
MKSSVFLSIAALLSFVFGFMMFFLPRMAGESLGLVSGAETLSLLRGMGGLIVGGGTINRLLRNQTDRVSLKALFLTNVVTRALGLGADA